MLIDNTTIGNVAFGQAKKLAEVLRTAGYKKRNDWRLPHRSEIQALRDGGSPSGQSALIWCLNDPENGGGPMIYETLEGTFTKCSTKESLETVGNLLLVAGKHERKVSEIIVEEGEISISETSDYHVLSAGIGPALFDNGDELASLFNEVEFMGISSWRMPTIEELESIYSSKDELEGFEKGNYWSSSEEKKYNAWKLNFESGEKIHCRKLSDYQDGRAFMMLIA